MPTFTTGQWNHIGSGSMFDTMEIATGAQKDYQGVTITPGTRVTNWYTGATNLNGRDSFVAWSAGGTWDTTNNQWIHAGANTSPVFEVLVFDINTGAWSKVARSYTEFLLPNSSVAFNAADVLFGVTTNVQGFVDSVSRYTDIAEVNATLGGGKLLLPVPGHMLQSAVWMPTVNAAGFMTYAGGYWNDFGQNRGCFEFSRTTNKWSVDIQGNDIDPGGTGPGDAMPGYSAAVWDSTRNRVLAFTNPLAATDASLYAYNPQAAQGSRVTRIFSRTEGMFGSSIYFSAVYDSRRDQMRVYGTDNGHSGQFHAYSFSSGGGTANNPAKTWFTVTGVPGINSGLGLLYDPVADKDVVWIGGTSFSGGTFSGNPNTLYVIDPTTGIGTAYAPGGVTVEVPASTGTGPIVSVFNRFAYLPKLDVYAVIPSNFTSGAYIFAPDRSPGNPLSAARPPALICTDLVSGPRANNSDTSFGQTANVDGAYVTLYGFNLGGVADTVSITLGGVACTIIDRGNCVSPRSPAALYNSYMQGQMIVFQVNHACPTGSQNIAVTVNGITSSTALSFTVTSTGSIYYAAPGGAGTGTFTNPFGNINTMFNAMAAGDVGYCRNGLDCTGGLALDSRTLGTAQWAFVVYPGASVQLGDATHDAVDHGFALGQNVTLSRFTVRGTSVAGAQTMTIGTNGRLVGCNIQVPGGNGSAGAVGVYGDNTLIAANEFTNIGALPTDDQYHVIYRYGRRSVPTPFVESGFRGTMNYIHGCNASRAFNCFNGENPEFMNNPIADHEIDHNVIVDQQWAGVGFLDGVVGTNLCHDNLFVRCGKSTGANGIAVAVQTNAGYQPDYPGTQNPILLKFYGNTFIDCGDTSSTTLGIYHLKSATRYSLYIQNNIHYQSNGIQYVTTGAGGSDSIAADATKRSNNTWFGAGSPPTFETGGLTGSPLFVSSGTGDYHLSVTSPCRSAGAALALTDTDLDGLARPSAGAWDLGCFQFVTGAVTPPPSVSLALSYDGKLRDRVGQGNTALAPDGALDGTFTVQLLATGGKTVTYARVDMRDSNGASIGIWDTDSSNVYFVTALSTGLDTAYLNNGSTMAVNFFLDNGSSVKIFCSDFSNIEFLDANVATVTLQFNDGTSASQSVTIGSEPEPPGPSELFNFHTVFMYGYGA